MWSKLTFSYLTSAALLTTVLAQNTESNSEFSPAVKATCKTGVMSINIEFNQPFNGIAHAREFRTPACMAMGNGSESLNFDISLMATPGSPNYCGVFWNNVANRRAVAAASGSCAPNLELADDKFYVITCGKTGFKNSKNETSTVSLRMLDNNGRKVFNAAFGLRYTLRAEISKSDGLHGIRLKIALHLTCAITLFTCWIKPEKEPVVVKNEKGTAELLINSMFRFADSSQVNFQCDIGVCKGSCAAVDCTSEGSSEAGDEEGSFTASTSVFVLDPNDSNVAALACAEGNIRPLWLLYLAIALGVMFLVMLLINCFLCTAMTCSCARTDVIEKDPSVVEDYDPYRSWHGSQYGSRYPSSTIHSTRSVSDNSDHYAIVQSRPGSRHSGAHRNRH